MKSVTLIYTYNFVSTALLQIGLRFCIAQIDPNIVSEPLWLEFPQRISHVPRQNFAFRGAAEV